MVSRSEEPSEIYRATLQFWGFAASNFCFGLLSPLSLPAVFNKKLWLPSTEQKTDAVSN